MFFEVIQPILECNFFNKHDFFVYQRVTRKFGSYNATNKAIEKINSFKPDVIMYFFTWHNDNINPIVLSHAKSQIYL